MKGDVRWAWMADKRMGEERRMKGEETDEGEREERRRKREGRDTDEV